MRLVHHVTKLYKILDAKPEANRRLGRPRHKWKDNIKVNKKRYVEVVD